LSTKLSLGLLPALLGLKGLLGLPHGTLVTSRAQACCRPGLLLKDITVHFVLLYALPRSSKSSRADCLSTQTLPPAS
jgi:hypothetical protein